jgi:hypothetical protein
MDAEYVNFTNSREIIVRVHFTSNKYDLHLDC